MDRKHKYEPSEAARKMVAAERDKIHTDLPKVKNDMEAEIVFPCNYPGCLKVFEEARDREAHKREAHSN